jgi:hypothetical protein
MTATLASPESPSPSQSPLLYALMGEKTDRLKKALAAYWTVETAWKIGKKWWSRAQTEMTFTVAIGGDDDIYPEVHRWLLEKLPPSRRRALVVRSVHRRDDEIVPEGGRRRSPSGLRQFYDGTKNQTVDLGEHKVQVSLERPAWAQGVRFSEADERRLAHVERILFTARGAEGRDAVLAFLTEIAERQVVQPPKLYVATRWGGWNRMSDVPPRPLGSVVLDAGQKESLLSDMEQFLASERQYARLGIPWHRGYLLEGPAGTGKTSLAKALAGHFHLDVHYVPLSVIEDDSRLTELFTSITRGMLLLEDIEVVHGAREADDSKPGVTLAGLRNVLDGFVTPHGLIMVMTTNNADVLDPGLLRPGRIDRREHIGFLTDLQLEGLLDAFVPPADTFVPRRNIEGTVEGREIAPCQVIDIVKRHLGDRDAVLADVKALVG